MSKLKLNKACLMLNATAILHYFMTEYPDCISSMVYYKSTVDVSIHVEREGLKADTIKKEISKCLLAGYSFDSYINDALKYEILHIIWRV